MLRFIVRGIIIILLFTVQQIWLLSPLYLFAVLLLVDVYVSAKESYILACGVGLLLDAFHWTINGLPVALTFLLLLKIIEILFSKRRTGGEVPWHFVLFALLCVTAVYLLAGIAGSFIGMLGRSVVELVLISCWTAILYLPIQYIGERYRKIYALA